MLLKNGSKGDDVKKLQEKLGVEAIGTFGPKTEAAVKAWQKANGLKDDGIVGDNNGAKQEHARQKISQSKLGQKREPFSDEWRAKMAVKKQGKNNPRFGAIVSEDTKQKMREKALGRAQSAETIKKKADAVRGSKREKTLCPHCDQLIAVNGYARWHGINCKSNLHPA